MGFKTEFNWILKLKPEQGFPEVLEVNKEYNFLKDGYRVYPLDIPIDLVNENWEAVAKAVIVECTLGNGKTKGIFKIVKIYEGKEKEVMKSYLKD